MTEQEAKIIIEAEIKYCSKFSVFHEALCKAKESLEKQIPKFVKCPNGWRGDRYTRYRCPNCNRILRMDEEWCNRCGQHLKKPKKKIIDNHIELDWSEENDK